MHRPLILLALAAGLLAGAPVAEAARRHVPVGFEGVVLDRAAKYAPAADKEEQWALMARSGVESVRTVFSWLETQPDGDRPPDFANLDELVALAARHNIKLLPVIQYSPPWAARYPGILGSPPRHISDYTAFLRALVVRYGPNGFFWQAHPELPRRPLRDWQIWNEPHLRYHWYTPRGARNSWAPQYARMLKASTRAIKTVDPGATIVLAALADFAWKHLARLDRLGIRRYYDVAALNLFTARPKLVLKGVRLIRRVLRAGGASRKQLWLTETTWPAGKHRVPVPRVAWQRAWYTTDRGMARRLGNLYAAAAARRRHLRLGRVYWYTWASSYDDGDLFDYAGLVRYSGGPVEPLPALRVYAASARRLQGCAKTAAGVCSP